MEDDLTRFLTSNGVASDTLEILEKESVNSCEIFFSLNQDHLSKLLSIGVKVGQHALLVKLLRERCDGSTEFSSWSPASSMASTSKSFSPPPVSMIPASSMASTLKSFSPPPTNIKELAEMYKSTCRSTKPEKGKVQINDPRKMMIILGGMIYDHKRCRGVKYGTRQPNPQKVELLRRATLIDVFNKAKELFFESKALISDMCLGDSNGLVINFDQTSTSWTLESYYRENSFKASRHRLYVILDDEQSLKESDIFSDDENDDQYHNVELRAKGDKIYKQGYVLPIIVTCVECGEEFRTYVPGKDTLMPDGTIICLQEGTDICPNCNGGSWLTINKDLFPHLVN